MLLTCWHPPHRKPCPQAPALQCAILKSWKWVWRQGYHVGSQANTHTHLHAASFPGSPVFLGCNIEMLEIGHRAWERGYTHTYMYTQTHTCTYTTRTLTKIPYEALTHSLTYTAVLYVIYWRDIKLSAVVLGVCLMTLLTLSLNTFIHTLVLIQLSFLVVTLTYIVTKIAIDSFYNRDIANPFKLVIRINTLPLKREHFLYSRYCTA